MAKNTEERKVRIVAEGKQAEATIKQMRAASALLNAELQKLPRNSQAFANKMKEFQQVQAQLRQTTREVHNLNSASQMFWRDFKRLAAGVLGGNLLTGIANKLMMIGSGALKMKMDIEEAMVDVQKVTNLTAAEMKVLQERLGALDTRTSKKDLMELAWAAGKLGTKGVDDISGFVKAANQIQVALGKDLGRDAIQQIGKMVSIFKLEDQFGIEDGMLKIASAINEIGMASTASEGYLVEFAKRMSGVAGIAGLSAPDIIALAGTLDSLGQTSETSSTALSKLFVRMGKDVETFAKFAKMDVQEFSDLLQKDAMAALKAMLVGVENSAGGVEDLAATLGELGLDGGRVVGVLGSLAKNTDELTRQQEIANKAFGEGVSVTNEYNKKNNSLEASWVKLKKAMHGVLVNNMFVKGFTDLVFWGAKLAAKTDELIAGFVSEKTTLFQLQLELNRTSTSTQRRSEIIQTIKDKYPEYLSFIDKEKISNEALNKVLGKINDKLVEQIILRRKQVIAEDYGEKVADAEELKMNAAAKLQKRMEQILETRKDINMEELKGLDLIKQAEMLAKKLPKVAGTNQGLGLSEGRDVRSLLEAEIMGLKILENSLNTKKEKFNDLMKEADEYKEKLKDIEKQVPRSFGPEEKGPETFDPFTNVREPKTPKEYESLAQKIRDINTKLISDIREREKKALDDKLEDEKEAIKKSTAKNSEKNEAIRLLDELHKSDLDALNKKHDKLEYESKVELLSDMEMAQKAYLAKMVANGEMSKSEEAAKLKELEISILEQKKELAITYGHDINKIEYDLAKARTETEKDLEKKKTLDKITELQYQLALENEYSLKRLAKEKEILDASMAEEINNTILTEEQKQLIEDYYREEKKRKEKEHWQHIAQIAGQALQEIGNIYRSSVDIKNNKDQARLQVLNKQSQEEIALLDRQLANEMIKKETYDRRKLAIEEDLRAKESKIKEEQFKRQQKADIVQAIINTAVAVTRALSVDPTGILATLVGISGAMQVAAIRSRPVPQFFEGGSTMVKGQEDGRTYRASNVGSFSSGGSINSASVGLIGEKGPELVIPNWLYTAPQTADLMGALESMIESKQFAAGGRTVNESAMSANNSPQANQAPQIRDSEIIALLASINHKLDKPVGAKLLWNQTEYEHYQRIEKESKRMSSLG